MAYLDTPILYSGKLLREKTVNFVVCRSSVKLFFTKAWGCGRAVKSLGAGHGVSVNFTHNIDDAYLGG